MINLILHSLQPSRRAVNFILAQLYIGVNTGHHSPLWDKRGGRLVPGSPGTQRLALPHAAARGRHGRASRCRDGTASGIPAQRRARQSEPARQRSRAGQAHPETAREKAMSDQIDLTREQYELAKVALERSDVP